MLLLHTDSLSQYGLHRIFRFAKAAGYDGVELAINDKKFDTQDPEYLQRVVDETGMPIKAVQTSLEPNKDKIKNAYEIAEKVHADVVTILPPKKFSWKDVRWIRENIPRLRTVSRKNITILNAPSQHIAGIIPKYSFNSIKDLKDFRQITLDTSNLFSYNFELLEIYRKLKTEIRHIHLSNYRGEKDHSLPNEGRLPLESFLRKAKKQDYQGHFSLKVRPQELQAGKTDERVIETLQKAKKFYDEYFQ